MLHSTVKSGLFELTWALPTLLKIGIVVEKSLGVHFFKKMLRKVGKGKQKVRMPYVAGTKVAGEDEKQGGTRLY